MPTPFSFEYVFRAAAPSVILDAYFDPDHLATQDKLAELGDRTVVSDEDTPERRTTSWRVISLRPLPSIARPFVDGGKLVYIEQMIWRRADDEVDLTVIPQILGERVRVTATYQLTKIGDDQVRRRYAGSVSANIPLLSGKIERGIVAEIEKAMPMMAGSTQGWLDRTAATRG